jgi:hypothetical protein
MSPVKIKPVENDLPDSRGQHIKFVQPAAAHYILLRISSSSVIIITMMIIIMYVLVDQNVAKGRKRRWK